MDYYPIEIIPIDIIKVIINLLDTRDKILFISTNTYFLRNIYIYSVTINKNKISQNIIEQDKFKNIKYLQLHNIFNTLNMMYLSNLTYLYVRDTNICGISGLTNLKSLYTNSILKKNSITQNDIANLSLLTHLYISFNSKITSIMHLTNLVCLAISGIYSNIWQSTIMPLTSLTYLDIGNNTKITNLSHIPNLKYLRVNNINQIDISKSYNLRTLNILNFSDTAQKINILHLTNLTRINASPEFIEFNKIMLSRMTNLINIKTEYYRKEHETWPL